MNLRAKYLSILFGVLTVLLLCIGSAAVAYNYSYMQYIDIALSLFLKNKCEKIPLNIFVFTVV